MYLCFDICHHHQYNKDRVWYAMLYIVMVKGGVCMPRPQCCRRVCSLPRQESFTPDGKQNDCDTIVMTVDEYEVIRLMDLVGLTQEQAAVQMDVGRTTVTGIYESARHKVALALVYGRRLLIQGGKIQVCERAGSCCNPFCRAVREKRDTIPQKEHDTQ